MNPSLLEHMACPRHQAALSLGFGELTCNLGCRFPVVDGVPIMLLDEARQTMELARTSLRQSRTPSSDGGLFVDSIGVNDEEKRGILRLAAEQRTGIDPVVSFVVAATNGIAYRSLIGRLKEYLIPNMRLPPGCGRVLLDIGCNWGRWCVAASRKGYKVIGIDPSLGAVMAAKRVTRQLGIEADFIVGDARYLPLRSSAVDNVFSYSVRQHLCRDDVALVASEINRVLKGEGTCLVQMPTKFGLRCIYHQMRRRFRDAVGFEVRYWTLPSLKKFFSSHIGETTFSVDCYFGIGLQYSDLRLMPPLLKAIVALSEGLRLMSRVATPLIWVADSVYVTSVKRKI